MRRIFLVCGVLSPILYATADLVAGLSYEGYSFRDQVISELGAVGAPSRPLFSALLVPVYLLLGLFGIGAWRSAEGNRRIRIVGGLLIGLAMLALTVGQFVPMRARGTPQGLTGMLHLVEGGVAMAVLLVAMALAASALGRRFRLYTAGTIVIVIGFGALTAIQGPRIEAGLPTPWLGVQERIFWYAYQLWFAVLAIRLLSRDREVRTAGGGPGRSLTATAGRTKSPYI